MSKNKVVSKKAELGLEYLENQLASAEQDLETAKAAVYRTDGIVQLLKHQISILKAPAEASEKPAEVSN